MIKLLKKRINQTFFFLAHLHVSQHINFRLFSPLSLFLCFCLYHFSFLSFFRAPRHFYVLFPFLFFYSFCFSLHFFCPAPDLYLFFSLHSFFSLISFFWPPTLSMCRIHHSSLFSKCLCCSLVSFFAELSLQFATIFFCSFFLSSCFSI